jgi:GntR family transcriptional regulator
VPLDPHSHVPIYEQIIEHIRGSVVAGVYCPGEALPSIRALAVELLVNPNTVQRAYQELERQGLICMRRGMGAFVAKDGWTSAQDRLEKAVIERFRQGIQVGRAANMSPVQLKALFHKTLSSIAANSSDQPETDPSSTRSHS